MARMIVVLGLLALAGCKVPTVDTNFTIPYRTGIYAVDVNPTGWVLIAGDSVRLTARAWAQECDIDFCRDISVASAFSWTSLNPSVVTVASGLVRGIAPGMTTVMAEAAGVRGFATVRVGSRYVPLERMASGGRCATTTAGVAYCWGDSDFRSPDTALAFYQPRLLAGGRRFTAMAVGSAATCGITIDSRGLCWGSGDLGDGASHFSIDPVLVAGGRQLQSLSAGKRGAANSGNEHSCAVATDGAAWCWGANDAGQLGSDAALPTCYNGEIGHEYPCSSAPVRVVGGVAFSAISAGGAHTCALTAAGAAYCWGDNRWGQLGDSTTASHGQPALVRGVPPVATLVTGVNHTCALTQDGRALCWGRNVNGELGTGSADSTPHPAPAPVTGDQRFTSIDAADATCGLVAAGQAYCWGSGILGPTVVAGEYDFRSLGVEPGLFSLYGLNGFTTGFRACGIASDNRGYCWINLGPPFRLVGPVE